MVVRLRILPPRPVSAMNSAQTGVPGQVEMFASMTQAQSRRWSSVACSILIHAGALFGVVYLFDHTPQTVASLSSRYTVRMIRFQPPSLPEHREQGSSAESSARKKLTSPAGGAASAGPAPEADPAPPVAT